MAASFRFSLILLAICLLARQQSAHPDLLRLVEQRGAEYQEVSQTIWGFAELGYQKTKARLCWSNI